MITNVAEPRTDIIIINFKVAFAVIVEVIAITAVMIANESLIH